MLRITGDLFDVTEFAHHCPEEVFIAMLKGAVSFLILSGINLQLTLIIFLFIPIMAISCTWLNLKVRAAMKKQRIISRSLVKLAEGRTTLTIAHRLTTIQSADRILVLEDGRIPEEGNHRQLMEKQGIYCRLYSAAQLQGQQELIERGVTV